LKVFGGEKEMWLKPKEPGFEIVDKKCNFKPFQTLILPFESGNPKSRITWQLKYNPC